MRFTNRPFRASAVFGLLLLAIAVAAGGAGSAVVKPVIGKATGTPAKPVAGERFALSVKVTGAPAGTTAAFDVKSAGKAVVHTNSYRAGSARTSFLVPAAAKALQVGLTVKAGATSVTKSFAFAVMAAPKPVLSIGSVTANEGNAGTTTMSFPVTLSKASKQSVSVMYATADGTAKAPADYAAANGSLTFAPGETSKTVAVSVVADTAIETDETFSVALSSPVNATLGQGTATGTIKNEDTQVPVVPGSYKGQLPSGDFLYFEVTAARQMKYFRINSVKEPCDPGGYFEGSLAFQPDTVWPITDAGLSGIENSWSGSERYDDGFEYLSWGYKVVAQFNGASVSGTFLIRDEFNLDGYHFTCNTGTMPWTATKVG